ncbi:hypothetical protein A2U01_0031005, partial [Trifolium medium]|nr:hypothetical protein [Trifolium medium]
MCWGVQGSSGKTSGQMFLLDHVCVGEFGEAREKYRVKCYRTTREGDVTSPSHTHTLTTHTSNPTKDKHTLDIYEERGRENERMKKTLTVVKNPLPPYHLGSTFEG